MNDKKRQLLWHGMVLFLLGLLVGLVEQKFTNTRMGLAAHLEGVMNGTFLIALGAIWAEVRLPHGLKAAAYWSALLGAYGNWAITTLAAIFGTADCCDDRFYDFRGGDRCRRGADSLRPAEKRGLVTPA